MRAVERGVEVLAEMEAPEMVLKAALWVVVVEESSEEEWTVLEEGSGLM